MRFTYSYRYIHTHIYIHVGGNLCVWLHHHKHTSGKRQHCKILVRFFFTHHWRHLFPSLDLDYVTVKKSERQGNIKTQRRTKNVIVSHTFSREKKKSSTWQNFCRKRTPTTTFKKFNLLKILVSLWHNILFHQGENKLEVQISHRT